MNFKMGNLTSRNFIMKLVELVRLDLANKEIMRKSSSQVMSLIVLLVFRLGSSGDMIIWGSGPEWAKYYSFLPLKKLPFSAKDNAIPQSPWTSWLLPREIGKRPDLRTPRQSWLFFYHSCSPRWSCFWRWKWIRGKVKILQPFQILFYICWCLSARHVYINCLPLRCVSSTCSASYSTSAREQSRSLQQEMPRQTEPWSVF